MAAIVAEFSDILGESQVAGFAEKLDVLSIRDAVETATPPGSRTRAGRTVGQAKFSDLQLTRIRDRASPKLAEACSAGFNVGEVKIHLFRTVEQGPVVYLTYTLTETFVSRIEFDTVDESGVAYQPHLDTSVTNPPSIYGAGAAVANVTRALRQNMGMLRLAPRSLVSIPRGASTNVDVERVWLNASQVRWSYTPYSDGRPGGAIEKSWNIQQGAEA